MIYTDILMIILSTMFFIFVIFGFLIIRSNEKIQKSNDELFSELRRAFPQKPELKVIK